DQLADGEIARFACEIVQRDLHGTVDPAGFRIAAGTLLEQDSQRIGIADSASDQKWRDQAVDELLRRTRGFPGSVAEQTLVRRDANEHRVTFHYDSFAAEIAEPKRFGEGK